MKFKEAVEILEYAKTFSGKPSKAPRMERAGRKTTAVRDLIELPRDLDDLERIRKEQADKKSEKKDDKKDDKKGSLKIDTLNQALVLATVGPFVGIFLAEFALKALGVK